ncbi:hypothetical protein [Salibacterium lacus]|uniref:KOW domain-containing protein n=1 Tax=Salibacterium lacus TaxID=1898109 RepID=A0ABW5SYY9_9BACI
MSEGSRYVVKISDGGRGKIVGKYSSKARAEVRADDIRKFNGIDAAVMMHGFVIYSTKEVSPE